MKRYFCHISAIIISAVALVGCVDLSGPLTSDASIRRMSTLAELAALDGATADLAINPQHRPAFEIAVTGLNVLLEQKNFDAVAFAKVLNALPVPELHGLKGRLIINNALIIWNEYAADTVNLDKAKFIQPVIVAVRDGLQSALAH